MIRCDIIWSKGGDRMQIGSRIKELRKSLNLTQAEFGEKIGLKASAIGLYESNSRNITDRNISFICSFFRVSERWLRAGEGEMFLKMNRNEALTAWASELIKRNDHDFPKRFAVLLSSLNEQEWELLEKIAIKLANGIKSKKD